MADRHTAAIRRLSRPSAPTSASATSPRPSSLGRRPSRPDGSDHAAQGGRLLNVHDGWVAANAEPIEVGSADMRGASTFVRRFESGLRGADALHVAA
jgi:hypothetical protein